MVAFALQHRSMPDDDPDRTRPARAARGPTATRSPPAQPDHRENSASTIIEAPLKPGRPPLQAHDFPDGGGSGGAQAFPRSRAKARRAP